MAQFLFNQLRHQWVYRPELQVDVFQYQSRGGAFVPLVLRSGKMHLGIIPILSETPNRHDIASARSFFGAYKHSHCIFPHLGNQDRVLTPHMRVLPISKIV